MGTVEIAAETLADLQVGDVLVQRSIHERSLPILSVDAFGLANRLQESMREELAHYGIESYQAGQKVTDLAESRVEIEIRLEIASLPSGAEQTVTLAGVPLWGIFVAVVGALSVLSYNLSSAIKSTRELVQVGGEAILAEGFELGKLVVAGLVVWVLVANLGRAG